jgi:hypothetical protein
VILEGLKLKLAAGAAIAAVAACASLTIWALLERSGRLEAKVELQRAVDQVAVLARSIDGQNESIQGLVDATAASRGELEAVLGAIGKQHASTRASVARLEASLQAPTPKAPDGRELDCRDAIGEWRREAIKR